MTVIHSKIFSNSFAISILESAKNGFRIRILILEKRHQTCMYFDKAGNEKLSLKIFSVKVTELGNAFIKYY